MKIFVTGGAGFIGSHFIKLLVKAHPNGKVINFDLLTYAGGRDNLKEVSSLKNYRFIKGDVRNAQQVKKAMAGCDSVVHFAAETHVDRSIKNANNFIETNILGTHVLLEAARKEKIKRFVHVSTDEVYGSRRKGFFKEEDSLSPSSPYSASKASADLLVKSYFTTYGLPVIITRSSNNFGPNQYPEKVIPLFITRLLKGKKVPLYADGSNIRDWIYVEDNCRAIDLALRKGTIGEIYNIAAENYLTNAFLTKAILRAMKKPISMIQHVQDRPGHDFRYAINCAKIRKLGFSPKISFVEGLGRTISWYGENQSWWKKRNSR
ncbi:MAG: dTDP-glucose 4,6-dehydratase [Candidatus Omnitrophota bacterium]